MQRDASSAHSPDVSADQPRAATNVPSDQLWRDAISATRRAATAAAELREALHAKRAPERRGGRG